MTAADGTKIAERYIMDFPEAFKFIEETAPDKETHHPKCSYRQAGMLCDCSIIWAEYHKRRANQSEERERVLRVAQTVSCNDITAWLRAFLIQEDSFGDGVPDFWDELNMTERLATALSEAGFSRAALATPAQPQTGGSK